MKIRIALLIGLVLVAVGIVLGHEGREIEGYELHFGWRVEPAITGFPNGPEVTIHVHEEHSHDGEEAAEGEEEAFPTDIEVSLQVEVTFGSESRIIAMRQAWEEPGHYIADLIPTLPGDYSFRVFGTIGETEVDEVFTSVDGQFSSVEPSSDVMFPAAGIADTATLLERIAELEARIAELEGK